MKIFALEGLVKWELLDDRDAEKDLGMIEIELMGSTEEK